MQARNAIRLWFAPLLLVAGLATATMLVAIAVEEASIPSGCGGG